MRTSASQPLCLALNPGFLIDAIIPRRCLHWQPVASRSSSKGPFLGRTWSRGGWALAGVWRRFSGSGLCVLPTSPHKARQNCIQRSAASMHHPCFRREAADLEFFTH